MIEVYIDESRASQLESLIMNAFRYELPYLGEVIELLLESSYNGETTRPFDAIEVTKTENDITDYIIKVTEQNNSVTLYNVRITDGAIDFADVLAGIIAIGLYAHTGLIDSYDTVVAHDEYGEEYDILKETLYEHIMPFVNAVCSNFIC